jgi:hypothetical protein
MISGRIVGGLAHPQMIEKMERELTEVIEDFDCAVDLGEKSGKPSLSRSYILNTFM